MYNFHTGSWHQVFSPTIYSKAVLCSAPLSSSQDVLASLFPTPPLPQFNSFSSLRDTSTTNVGRQIMLGLLINVVYTAKFMNRQGHAQQCQKRVISTVPSITKKKILCSMIITLCIRKTWESSAQFGSDVYGSHTTILLRTTIWPWARFQEIFKNECKLFRYITSKGGVIYDEKSHKHEKL